ncbi:hypothetical protein GOBAR_DD03574 [Gossypium barbadense]|nr:hypothetical protein GOBAR_DD03574 [Gossypium barbadense]
MLEFYITKRVLAESKKGPFEVTIHVDSCWRCDPDSEKNRKELAYCAPSFARGTTGGKDGDFYVVTDPIDNAADPNPRTLRHLVTKNGPLWIIFKGPMTIKLQEELIVTSDKTIDARGANAEIFTGTVHLIIPAKGGKIKDGENHHGLRGDSDGDGVSLYGATNVWLDHLSLHHCTDGLIDLVQGSTAVTISSCHFTDHNDVMLFRASDSYSADNKMQVTVALNHFGKGLVERMPRWRFGFIHVVNNDYNHWFLYAIGGTSNPTIISQGNRYSTPVTCRGLLKPAQWKNWNWVSQGDHFKNGAFLHHPARELEAIENLDKAYHSNPEEVVRHYNDHFSRTMLEFYITKRVLAESKKDPFEVTNHIDSCWRYDPDWEKNRKKLVDCAPGFARGTTGGKDGEFYVVPNPIDNAADPKPGTLRHAVTQTEPLWITFKGSMTIKLQQELIVTSDKTIDAREANVEIFNGAGITIQYAKNVTNHGLQIHHIIPANGGKIKDGENHHGLRGDSDGDGVSLFGATTVWLNHLSLHHYTDGLVDGDHFEKGAFFTPSGNPSASKQIGADKMMPFKPGQMVPELTKYAEPLSCTIGRPC